MFYRRRPDLERLMLLQSSRNVLVQLRAPGTTHALICWTGKVLSVHYGIVAGSFQSVQSEYFSPAGLHDGHGWNLYELICLIEEL